ncbi:uncharacterized protein [Maniola hyperantus]|uniref:uncharacterized protein isoform X2 n=1 Tax=Aphantopus hyperantus TaxID=2795564 RepID=UPI002136BBA7
MALDCDWNNELTLKFVRHIAAERALWDFNDPKYKLKHKVNEAWSRISSRMNRPVDALKNKKKVLMATWRPLFRKKMASLKAQAAEDEVFQPVWFAYDAMESYLGSVYDIDGSLTTEYLKQHEEPTAPSPSPSNQSEHSDDITVLTIKKENDERTDSSTTTTPHLSKKRKNFMGINYNEGQNIHYSSFDPLNSESASQGASASASRAAQRTEEGDECDIYAKLLARRLRKYPGKMRDRMMYKIDGLLLDNPYPDELSSPCSSYHYHVDQPDGRHCRRRQTVRETRATVGQSRSSQQRVRRQHPRPTTAHVRQRQRLEAAARGRGAGAAAARRRPSRQTAEAEAARPDEAGHLRHPEAHNGTGAHPPEAQGRPLVTDELYNEQIGAVGIGHKAHLHTID